MKYTVKHSTTHEDLYPGRGEAIHEVLRILRTRLKARVSGQLVDFDPSHWYVCAWDDITLRPGGMPEPSFSMSALQFLESGGTLG